MGADFLVGEHTTWIVSIWLVGAEEAGCQVGQPVMKNAASSTHLSGWPDSICAVVGEPARPSQPGGYWVGAEGATAPETLRLKDRDAPDSGKRPAGGPAEG